MREKSTDLKYYPSRNRPPLNHPRGKILLVDDDFDTREIFKAHLASQGFRVYAAENSQQMKQLLLNKTFDIVLLDLFLGEVFGLDEIYFILKESPHTHVAILTGKGNIDHAIKAMNQGASAFFLKSEDLHTLSEKIEKLITKQKSLISDQIEKNFCRRIIGKSSAIRDLIKRIEKVKNVDSTILITGDSGTGKELVARAIHDESDRKDKPFAAINCGAIPKNLLESELFGHRKGAFTDAKANRKGVFETASEGTLFLDEIGEMPQDLQVKLLRVLQEKEIVPIGGNFPIPVNTRVVLATNKDLWEEVKKRNFREDLFFRIFVIELKVPPLRDRIDDIPLLANFFRDKFCLKYQKEILPIDNKIVSRLKAYRWPGNVRELQNMIERAVVLSHDNQLHFEDMFPSHGKSDSSIKEESDQSIGFQDGYPLPYLEAKRLFERNYLENLLEFTKGNISEAARLSGQYRANIYRLVQKFQLDIEKHKHF